MNPTAKLPILFLIVSLSSSVSAIGQQKLQPLGWDLTYRDVFSAANVPQNDTVAKFFEDSTVTRTGPLSKMFPAKFLTELQSPDIQAAIMIDYQAFYYFGHRVSSLYLKTSDETVAHSYASKGGYDRTIVQTETKMVRLLDGLWEWQQSQPNLQNSFAAPEGYVYSGYIGAISLYRDDESRQVLLTSNDILEVDSENGSGSDGEAGRLYRYMDFIGKVGGSYAEFLAEDTSRPSTGQRKLQKEEKRKANLKEQAEACELALQVGQGDALVFFTASWAQPALQMRPIIENAAKNRNLRLVEKDFDDNKELAANCNVYAVPTVIALKSGKRQADFKGKVSAIKLDKYLNAIYN